MELQNAFNFGNRLWIAWRAMVRWNDELGLSALQVRAPISHNTITAVRGIMPAAIAEDCVIWNTRCDRHVVNLAHESIIRRKRVDAIGDALQLHGPGIMNHRRVDRL